MTQTPKKPASLAVYLNFPGTCREALQYYAQELGGTMGEIHSYRDAPEGTGVPDEWLDQVMHGEVTVADQVIMGSDAPPGSYEPAQGMFIQLYYDDVLTAEQAYNRLSDGGTTRMPFGPSFWAKGFGMLTDRFGIGWVITSCYIEAKDWG